MAENRPPIPNEIKRTVRQRSGFGCVICGTPFVLEYDHIIDYSIVKEHEESNLTLLCKQHHGEKTAKLLTREELIRATQNPINKQTGTSAGYKLRFYGDTFKVIVGGGTFTMINPTVQTQMDALVINNEPIVSFRIEDSIPLVTLNIYNSKGEKVLYMVDNIVEYKIDSWDIESIGNRIIVRENPREIVVELEFSPPNILRIIRGKLSYKGAIALIFQDRIEVVDGGTMIGGSGRGRVGLAIGERSKIPAAIWMPTISTMNRSQ